MNVEDIRTIEFDGETMRAVIVRHRGRLWANVDDVWLIPGSFVVLSEHQAKLIAEAETLAAQ